VRAKSELTADEDLKYYKVVVLFRTTAVSDQPNTHQNERFWNLRNRKTIAKESE
jgi:hypothetical protein